MSQRRRRRLLLAAGGLVAAPLALAEARKVNRVPMIGYLSPEAVDPEVQLSEIPTAKALRKRGWIEGQTLVIERRFAAHDPERLAGLARELVDKRVKIIVAYTGSAAVAAARETRTIPIVFISVPYPVEQGLVDSFARPGRNVTGTSIFVSGVGVKRFEFLRAMAPAVKRAYVILAAEFLETVAGRPFDRMASLRTEGAGLGFEVQGRVIHGSRDIEAALLGALQSGAQAIFPGPGVIPFSEKQRIVDFALQHGLPSLFSDAGWVEAGGLLSYGISWAESLALIDRSMDYVHRILRGAKPADLPVVQPSSYELVINRKTAKALELNIPSSLLVRADRLID